MTPTANPSSSSSRPLQLNLTNYKQPPRGAANAISWVAAHNRTHSGRRFPILRARRSQSDRTRWVSIGGFTRPDARRCHPAKALRYRSQRNSGLGIPSPAPNALIKRRIVDDPPVRRAWSLASDAQADQPNDQAKQQGTHRKV